MLWGGQKRKKKKKKETLGVRGQPLKEPATRYPRQLTQRSLLCHLPAVIVPYAGLQLHICASAWLLVFAVSLRNKRAQSDIWVTYWVHPGSVNHSVSTRHHLGIDCFSRTEPEVCSLTMSAPCWTTVLRSWAWLKAVLKISLQSQKKAVETILCSAKKVTIWEDISAGELNSYLIMRAYSVMSRNFLLKHQSGRWCATQPL